MSYQLFAQFKTTVNNAINQGKKYGQFMNVIFYFETNKQGENIAVNINNKIFSLTV